MLEGSDDQDVLECAWGGLFLGWVYTPFPMVFENGWKT